MSFISAIRRFFGGRKPKVCTHPDTIEVHPSSYRNQVRDAFWFSVQRLEGDGIYGHRHRIKTVKIIQGTVLREKGWAVPAKFSPTGYAGGWCGGSEITAVCNPITGEVPDSTLRHEWGEAMLDVVGVKGMDKRHELLRRVGL